MKGKNVCYIHGGKSPSGMASGTFKDGRYSKDLPTRLLSGYLEARHDPEILNLRDELAMYRVNLRELAQQLQPGPDGQPPDNYFELWDKITEKIDKLCRVVESERKRLVEMHQMLTAEQLLLIQARIVDIIKTFVPERDRLAGIINAFGSLVSTGDHRETPE